MTARRVLRFAGTFLLFLVIGLCLAATIVPRFLDRLYYRGPESGHYDGSRFFNPDGDEEADSAPGGGSRAAFFWRQATGSDQRPVWPTKVAVRPATPAELTPLTAPGAMRVTWVGHASVLVQVPGLNILTDPVWSDAAGPLGFGPRRVAEPGIRLRDLPRIDLVLVSHNHYDHLDLVTLKRLWHRDRPTIVTSLGNDTILRSAGIAAVARDWGGVASAKGVRVHVTRNHHWGSRWFTDRNRALWSSFVVELPGGNLFFAGDTGAGDFKWADDAAALGPIRLALLPIGAFRFREGQMASDTHVGPIDAVELFRRLGTRTALAVHWGTFRLSFEGYDTPPKLLKAAMACSGLGEGAALRGNVDRPSRDNTLARPRIDRTRGTPRRDRALSRQTSGPRPALSAALVGARPRGGGGPVLELTPLGGYRTTLDRSGLALAVGGVLGGFVATLLGMRGDLLSPPGLALLFVGASILTAAIITATAGPIWLVCHLAKHRGPLTAALVGAITGFALFLGGQTYGFGLYDMPVTDARTLTVRWLSATATSLIVAAGAAAIGLVMWRVAYRRDR